MPPNVSKISRENYFSPYGELFCIPFLFAIQFLSGRTVKRSANEAMQFVPTLKITPLTFILPRDPSRPKPQFPQNDGKTK